MNCVFCGIDSNTAAERSLGSICLNGPELRHRFSPDGFAVFMGQFPDPLRLNLGANDRRVPGFISVDIARPADFCCDLEKPWPWPDSIVAEVCALSVFEHLRDKRHTMNELWRVLVPGGLARLQLPHATMGDGGHCDPTHVSFWTQSDFEYYAPGVPERERFRDSPYYGIKADFDVVNLDKDGHIPMQSFKRTFGGTVWEMDVLLRAVKP